MGWVVHMLQDHDNLIIALISCTGKNVATSIESWRSSRLGSDIWGIGKMGMGGHQEQSVFIKLEDSLSNKSDEEVIA
jgi:hypothetical protein